MSRSTSYATEARREGILSQIFLGERSRWLIHFVWLVLIVIFAINDGNINPIVGLAIWLGGLFALVIGYGIWHWATTTASQRRMEDRAGYRHSGDDEYDWGLWTFFPGSLMILMTLGLLLLGPLGPSGYDQGFIVLSSPTGVRAVPSDAITLHLPVWQSVSWWDATQTVKITPTAKTADGKTVVADVKVTLSMDANPQAPVALSSKFGSPAAYAQTLQTAVTGEFAQAMGRYNLDNLPSHLTLEDHVGTRLGLGGLYARWSGAVIITNIHRFADVK